MALMSRGGPPVLAALALVEEGLLLAVYKLPGLW